MDRWSRVVDDEITTGATTAACRVARQRRAARVILAAPVIAADTLPALRREAEKVVSAVAPERLRAVGYWYEGRRGDHRRAGAGRAARRQDVESLLATLPAVVDVVRAWSCTAA